MTDYAPISTVRNSSDRAPRKQALNSSAGRLGLPAKIGLSPVVWCYLFAVVLPVSVNLGPLLITGLRGLMLVMIIPLFFQLILGRYGRLYLVDGLFVLHIIWMAVALYMNTPDMMVTQVGSLGIEFLGGYLIGRAMIRTREDFAALCRALVLVVCATLPFALFETLTGRPILLEIIRAITGLRGIFINNQAPRLGLERVQLTFAHPIHYGLFCSITFSFALVGLNGIYSTATRLFVSGIVAFCGFLALSSGAFLAIAIQMGLIAWSVLFRRIVWCWWLLIGMIALAYVVVDILSNRTPIMVALHYATFSAHTAYWRTLIFEWGMINVWANPIFGLGLNDWVRAWYMHSPTVDNFWLLTAMRYGIPGFLTVAIGYVLTILYVIRRDFSGDTFLGQQRLAWVFTMIGLTFTLSTVHIWSNIFSFVFFIFGAGMWFITAQPQSDKTLEPEIEDVPKKKGLPYTRFPRKG